MRFRQLVIAIGLLITCLAPALPAAAAEKNVFQEACNIHPATKTSATCEAQNAGDPITGSNGVLAKAARIISYLAGATAIILLSVGGVMYAISGGDASKISTAKQTIIYAVVGLVIVIFAQSIIIFVINKV